MTLEEAVACLANYNANPLPWHCIADYQPAEMTSPDGINFDVCLDDYEGYTDTFNTVQQYHDRMKVLRARGIHRWCISGMFCCIEATGEGATCVEGQNTR